MGSRKILIIDDDKELCEELAEFLSDEGYEVDVACDGRQGKIFLEQTIYGLLILDLKLPTRSGFDILKDIKRIGNGVKVMIVSGRPEDGVLTENPDEDLLEERTTLELADCVLSKPLHPEELLRTIRKLTREY